LLSAACCIKAVLGKPAARLLVRHRRADANLFSNKLLLGEPARKRTGSIRFISFDTLCPVRTCPYGPVKGYHAPIPALILAPSLFSKAIYELPQADLGVGGVGDAGAFCYRCLSAVISPYRC